MRLRIAKEIQSLVLFLENWQEVMDIVAILKGQDELHFIII